MNIFSYIFENDTSGMFHSTDEVSKKLKTYFTNNIKRTTEVYKAKNPFNVNSFLENLNSLCDSQSLTEEDRVLLYTCATIDDAPYCKFYLIVKKDNGYNVIRANDTASSLIKSIDELANEDKKLNFAKINGIFRKNTTASRKYENWGSIISQDSLQTANSDVYVIFLKPQEQKAEKKKPSSDTSETPTRTRKPRQKKEHQNFGWESYSNITSGIDSIITSNNLLHNLQSIVDEKYKGYKFQSDGKLENQKNDSDFFAKKTSFSVGVSRLPVFSYSFTCEGVFVNVTGILNMQNVAIVGFNTEEPANSQAILIVKVNIGMDGVDATDSYKISYKISCDENGFIKNLNTLKTSIENKPIITPNISYYLDSRFRKILARQKKEQKKTKLSTVNKKMEEFYKSPVGEKVEKAFKDFKAKYIDDFIKHCNKILEHERNFLENGFEMRWFRDLGKYTNSEEFTRKEGEPPVGKYIMYIYSCMKQGKEIDGSKMPISVLLNGLDNVGHNLSKQYNKLSPKPIPEDYINKRAEKYIMAYLTDRYGEEFSVAHEPVAAQRDYADMLADSMINDILEKVKAQGKGEIQDVGLISQTAKGLNAIFQCEHAPVNVLTFPAQGDIQKFHYRTKVTALKR